MTWFESDILSGFVTMLVSIAVTLFMYRRSEANSKQQWEEEKELREQQIRELRAQLDDTRRARIEAESANRIQSAVQRYGDRHKALLTDRLGIMKRAFTDLEDADEVKTALKKIEGFCPSIDEPVLGCFQFLVERHGCDLRQFFTELPSSTLTVESVRGCLIKLGLPKKETLEAYEEQLRLESLREQLQIDSINAHFRRMF